MWELWQTRLTTDLVADRLVESRSGTPHPADPRVARSAHSSIHLRPRSPSQGNQPAIPIRGAAAISTRAPLAPVAPLQESQGAVGGRCPNQKTITPSAHHAEYTHGSGHAQPVPAGTLA